jgi:metallo-beta-lactamase class B
VVLGSPGSVKVLQSGLPDKGDPQYPNLDPMTPIANTRAVRNSEAVKLGPLSVTAHYTPGHTKGATSWTWQSTEGGRTVDMVYADSLTAIAADGARFSGNPLYPTAQTDIEGAIATVASFKCDVLISAHPEAGELWERKAKQAELGNVAFIDKDACRKYAANARATLARTLKTEQGW